jgi:hypothetical protein
MEKGDQRRIQAYSRLLTIEVKTVMRVIYGYGQRNHRAAAYRGLNPGGPAMDVESSNGARPERRVDGSGRERGCCRIGAVPPAKNGPTVHYWVDRVFALGQDSGPGPLTVLFGGHLLEVERDSLPARGRIADGRI